MKRVFLYSTVGQKFLIGLTGVFLAVFVLAHMLGNLYLFISPKAYNMYSHALINNPFIVTFELLLLSFFAIHIIWALILTYTNKQKKGLPGREDPSSHLIHKTLWAQGVVIFIFVILHLITFKYGAYYSTQYNGVIVRDLFRLVTEVFQKPTYVIWYLLCLIILSFHLSHGLQASIRSLGFYSDSYSSWVQKICIAYSVIVTAGFISQPVYFFLFYQGGTFGN